MEVRFFHVCHKPLEMVEQVQFFFFTERICGKVPVYSCAAADFICHHRAYSGVRTVDSFADRFRFGVNCLIECFLGRLFWVLLLRRFRDKIGSSGKHFAHRADICADMFDAVNNCEVFFAENNVAVFSHQFHNEKFVT